MSTSRFGELLKDLRIRQGFTLREFCQKHGFDPGNMSKVERGLLPPPSHEKLEKIAQDLGLVPGNPEWDSLFDTAALEAGHLPHHVLSNEELLKKLPVFLRTLNNKKLTPEKLDELIEKLKNA